jgi:hypothetical protein
MDQGGKLDDGEWDHVLEEARSVIRDFQASGEA